MPSCLKFANSIPRRPGIVLMHDFQHATAEALPELLRELKTAGCCAVVPRSPGTTVPKYDEMLTQDKLSGEQRPTSVECGAHHCRVAFCQLITVSTEPD